MIADLKPYAAYKDSGLPWLGQVALLLSQGLHGLSECDAKAIAQQRMGCLLLCHAAQFNLPGIGSHLGRESKFSRNKIEKYPYRHDPRLFPVMNQFVLDQGNVAAMLWSNKNERPQ